MEVNWSEKCERPGGGIDRVHYAPEFTLVLIVLRLNLSISRS